MSKNSHSVKVYGFEEGDLQVIWLSSNFKWKTYVPKV